jgi:hypothetical protein
VSHWLFLTVVGAIYANYTENHHVSFPSFKVIYILIVQATKFLIKSKLTTGKRTLKSRILVIKGELCINILMCMSLTNLH